MWGAIIGAVGAGLKLFGDKKAADAQEEAADKNAALKMKEAEYQAWLTQEKVKELEKYKTQLIAKQRVKFAKAGVVMDAGTAFEVQLSSLREAEEDKAYILQNGAYNVERAQMGAQNFQDQAAAINLAGTVNQASTLLNFADTASKYWK